ncbi:rhamnulokinase [Angustibacter luteus]|uniref:Rhamnulokinase family protein n=1 Tax=Angustibacter luteus TaxID=658456 RepID=A0ABW1JGK3_9ACTN
MAVTSVSSLAAIDLGASSGRVVLARVGPDELDLEAVARFPNDPVTLPSGLHWNPLELYRNVLLGLRAAAAASPDGLHGAAVDSWAVDYALLRGGRMLGVPFHYRDARTQVGVDRVHARVSPEELYQRNGLQFLPFNTLYQLAADPLTDVADGLLLIPDLITAWLTGRSTTERTNASTTGLLDVATGRWDEDLIGRLALPRRLFGELVDAGDTVGPLLPGVAAQVGSDVPVHAVGSHDTASAVVGVPMESADAAYISCGTWGLVGVELEHAVLTEAGRAARFTNERGVDGRVRYLTNVMGLWLLNESVREWERAGERVDLPALLRQADQVSASVVVFDVQDERFLAPGDVPARIVDWYVERGHRPPESRPELVRCIVESLAQAFADAVEQAQRLSGQQVRVVHVVGGGSVNRSLCQSTADRTGRPVLAGPVEATAIGNVLVQARAVGALAGDLDMLRALVRQTQPTTRYLPGKGSTT